MLLPIARTCRLAIMSVLCKATAGVKTPFGTRSRLANTIERYWRTGGRLSGRLVATKKKKKNKRGKGSRQLTGASALHEEDWRSDVARFWTGNTGLDLQSSKAHRRAPKVEVRGCPGSICAGFIYSPSQTVTSGLPAVATSALL